MLTLYADVVLYFVDYAFGSRQMKRFIAVLNKTENAVLAVNLNKVRRAQVAFPHIGVGDFGLQMSHLV
jgi:hypothetical protein